MQVEMLLVPAGEFRMGEGGQAHRVYVAAFHLSRCRKAATGEGQRETKG